MGNGVTFNDKEQAEEYASSIREQGLVADVGRNRKTGQFLVEIGIPKVKEQKVKVETPGNTGAGIVKAARMFGKGIGDIGKSLATPSTDKRPKISQMPGSRREIGISQSINLEKLKMPILRGKDISGRRTR